MADTTYTDVASVQARTGKTYAGAELAYVTLLLTATTDFIEKYTSRVFYASDEHTEKTYYGSKKRDLEINDLLELDSLEEYDSLGNKIYTFEEEDYELHPFNSTAKSRITLIQGIFTGYKYIVTGTFGYSEEVPDAIKMVATEIIANTLEQKGGIKQESIEGYSYVLGQVATENPVIKGVLDGYKKILI